MVRGLIASRREGGTGIGSSMEFLAELRRR